MAIDEEILRAEARLGLELPPSFRRHLQGSQGSRDLPGDHGLTLLPVPQIDRFGQREPEWLAGWLDGYETGAASHGSVEMRRDDPADPATLPTDQLAGTIVISTTVDERVLLINPASIDEGGEWEAWDFANWYPGAYRYPSFASLVETIARGD